MKVSIITSCYNRAATIEGAIRSVFAQDYSDIEYIIVDGASKDGSQVVIEATIKDAPQNVTVKYISEPDKGMYEAINKGIRMATGEVIGLCHSDDFMFDDKVVSDYVHEFERTGADFVYADGIFVAEKDITKSVRRWIGGEYSRWKVRHGWLPLHPTCYIKKDFMMRNGLYDETYKIAADSDLLVRYLLSPDIKVHYMKNRFTTRMRMGGMSTDSSKRKKMWNEDIRVYSGYGFHFATLTKIEKMMWKIPQFIMAKLKNA
ncbi:MAG: glycosyltransferase [Prevotellaceae bacterium]|nr:glycosyltransferase [Candidatus Minthosoma equi]